LRDGRAARCERCQSSTGTNTAAAMPHLGTHCGPSPRLASGSALNRALAPCTGRVRIYSTSDHRLTD
jgi:hypothetical protein